MNKALDSQSIEIPCPHCSHKTSQTIGKLKTNPKLICAKCKGEIQINATDLRRQIAKIEKSLAELTRTISRLSK